MILITLSNTPSGSVLFALPSPIHGSGGAWRLGNISSLVKGNKYYDCNVCNN